MNSKFKRGAALVEFALVAPLFFLLTFAIIDFGRLFYTQMTLQEALREAGRFAVTGRKLPEYANTNRVVSIQAVAHNFAGVAMDQVVVNPSDGGAPGQPVSVSIAYDLYLITPFIGQFFSNGVYHFTVSTTFRNEPFPTQ